MKDSGYIGLITFSLTFFTTNIFCKLTGFNYNIFDGININLLFDLLLWAFSYFSIYLIVKNFLMKNTKTLRVYNTCIKNGLKINLTLNFKIIFYVNIIIACNSVIKICNKTQICR